MSHYSRLSKIASLASQQPSTTARWRSGGAAVGQELTQGFRYPEYHGAALHGGGSSCSSSGSATARAGCTWTFGTDDLDAEIARLEALGAERVAMVHAWWILRDPAGLLFCVVPEPAGSLSDGNAHPLGLAAPRPGKRILGLGRRGRRARRSRPAARARRRCHGHGRRWSGCRA